MNIAVLSDIHSNKYALKATLEYLKERDIDQFIFLGDFFGYYPWAQETYVLLKSVFEKSIHILGNHDELLLNKKNLELKPEYWDVLQNNKKELSSEALAWLSTLKAEKKIILDTINFSMHHGTPDDSLSGRYYPDDECKYKWFPLENEILLLGHTHYPLIRKFKEKSLLINPGSVGQPRDGITSSSGCIIDTKTLSVDFFRVPYLNDLITEELINMAWYPRAIQLLKKIK